jgi:hypothetical protein
VKGFSLLSIKGFTFQWSSSARPTGEESRQYLYLDGACRGELADIGIPARGEF